MAHIVTQAFVDLFKSYPLGSQESNSDPLVVAKLFNLFGGAVWYLTEFDPDKKLAFGYITGIAEDEWGYVSLDEMENIKHSKHQTPMIERDLYFTQKPISRFMGEC